MYKTKCDGCGYAHIVVGDLGLNWLVYVFKCDHCGSGITIRRVNAKGEDVEAFKENLENIKNVDEFLDL